MSKYEATDSDYGEDGEIRYNATIPLKWRNNVTLVNNTVNIIGFDREVMGSSDLVQLTIEAVDGGTPERTGMAVVIINVTGVNDNTPLFHPEDKNITIYLKEGSKYDDIHTSKAFDADIGIGSIISYRLSKGNETFSIDRDNGVISSKKTLLINNSIKGILTAEVEAFNNGSSKTDKQNITVILQDINNKKPSFKEKKYKKTVNECTESGTKILRVNASDADTTAQFNTVTYWLEEYNETFYVDHSTGDLFLVGPLDCDPPHNITNYTFQIFATDDIKQKNKSIFTTVEVTVSNCNDNAPVFTEDVYKCEIPENKTGEFNCSVKAFDLDGDTLVYEIVQPSQKPNFNISSASGTLSVVIQFNFDAMDNKEVFLNVSASDKNYTRYVSVTVNIINVNDEAPKFSNEIYNFSIAESNRTKLIVGQISATDKDGDLNKLQYSLKDSGVFGIGGDGYITTTGVLIEAQQIKFAATAFDADIGKGSIISYRLVKGNETFSIDENSGIISTNDVLWIKGSNKGILKAEVEAFNAGSDKKDTQCITLILQDINNNKPVFKHNRYTKEVDECSGPGTKILRVNATDADTTAQFNTVTYWLEEYNKTFYVDHSTGDLFLIGPLDCDTPQNITNYTFQIYATDDVKMENNSIFTTVEVTVSNCNDNAPVFTEDIYQCEIQENKIGEFNCSLQASDLDGDTLSYEIMKSPQTENFNISSPNGLLSVVTPFDYDKMDTKEVFLNVSASDKKYTSYATVIVTIVDENDERPVFEGVPYVFNITENMTIVPHLVGSVRVSDVDSSFNLSLNRTCSDTYNISVSENGDIIANRRFDYEDGTHSLHCEIMARDKLTEVVKQDLTINIIDVNDNAPVFANESSGVSITENASKGTSVIEVSASDADNSSMYNQVTYSIFGGNHMELFKINANTGMVSTDQSLASHGGENIVLIIAAEDNGIPPLAAYSRLKIHIENENIHRPVFQQQSYVASVKEDNGTIKILQVFATDEDNDLLYYTVLDHTDVFHFNNTSLLAKDLDAEAFRSTDGRCYFTIQVSDGTYNDTATVNITVIDINDNAPSFSYNSGNFYNLTLNDTAVTGENVLNITAKDRDISNTGFTFILYGGEGDFEINYSNGQLKLMQAFGRNGKFYNMSVIVIDHGNPPKSSTAQVIIHVQATNQNWHFNSSFEFNFSENSKSEQASIAATSDITITYEIISDNSFDNHDIFNLNKSTGLLTVANEANLLNFEKQSKYELVVSACDSAVFQRKFTANVTINVLDVNETPNITKYDKQVFVQENTTAETIISAVEAFDPDKNDILSFDLSDNQNFTIRNNGNISVKTNILKKGNYSLSITVKDKVGLTSSVTTYVIVPGVEFQTLVPDSVFENVSVPFLISNLTTEMYNMKLVYSISSSSYSGKFLVAKNGSLMLTEDLDREVTMIVNLHIQGRDVSHGILITDIKITVRVDDVNDCKPEFLSSSYTVTIDDVVANETRIAYIEAVDRDADEANRNLTYNIIGNYTDIFSMDGNKLKLDNSARLKTQQYHLTVSVTDGIFENSTSVRVIVLDTNNHSPAFSNRTYKFSVTETNNTGHSVGTVSAHDKDNDNNRNGEITYALSGGNKDSVFEINSTTGDIKTVTAIDREDKDTYTLIVTATDHGNNPRKGTCTVLVSVLDVNDNHPEFKGAAFFNASVQENSPNETAVVIIPEINVTDKDMGTNGTEGIVYRLNESEPFCMNETRPTIFVCGDLDREKKDLYHLEVIALDSNGNNGSLDTSATVTIYILDVNDETPQFTDVVYTFNVSENTDTVVNVGNVSATDKDSGGNKTLRYSIISGDDRRFYVDTFSGMIYAGGNIDRENQSTFTLNVSAFDGVNRNYTGVVINVTDVNDNPPVFEMITFQDSINVNIVEETQYGIIFNATAFDHDEIDSDNSKITYHFNFSDPDNGTDLFIINDDGGLNLTRPLDREKRDHYEVTITATDSGSPRLSSSLHVHVNVLDINDNRPEFCVDSRCDKHEADCSTVEKAPVSSVLILLGSKDLDFGENASVSYSIEKSNVSKYFRIDNETGVVSVADALVVNNLIQAGMPHSSDTADVQLSIVATDGGGLNTSLTLHVFVEPINDADVPVFKESPCKFNVNETNETGIAVGSCIATTNDTLSQMTYELISGYGIHSDVFIIDPKTGNITTQSALDREKTDRYVFAVQVRDGRIPERTAFSSVEITINDVNDNSPVFMNENITISVLENSTVFTHTNVTATDIDEGLNAEISYTLNTNTNDSIFINIDEKGKLTLNGTFDYEQKKRYEIIVTAMDKGIPPRTSSAEVHIVVIDVNDNSPEFENITDFYRLPENQPPSQIFTVYSTDEDSGWNGKVVYKLQNIEDVPFGIDPFNGTVYLQGKLDYESKTNYTLSIIAQDLGSPPQSTIKEVTIYVGDVYDYKLMFKKNIFDINITPTTPLNQSLLNLTVTVPQAYFSVKGKDSEYFNIENSTGNLFLVKPISAERQLYAIQVVAEDGHGQNASCTVIAHVMAHDVTFNTPEIKLHLMENLNETTVLVDLNTTEELSGNGAEYTILNVLPTGKDLFTVDRTTGVLRCNKPLDREEHAQYTILISAHASVTRRKREIPRPSSTIRIIVDVGDVNDNPPHFTSDQERAFGVPDNVRANYLVGKIQAEDRDTSDAGKLRYNVTGGRSDVFGVNMETGEIRTLVAIASTRSSNFYLSISVSDGNVLNKKATINVTIFVVPTKNQPSVLVNMAVGEFNNRIDAYRKNMSEILGVVIQFEKIEAHQEVDSDGVIHVDLSRTDLIFHGINRTSGLLVSNERMNELINSNLDELAQLFHQKQLVVSHVIIDVIADPSAISTTQILFICMAVFIFFGSLAALVVAQYSWTRYETERQETEKEAERIKEVELSTIRSRQSSKLSSMMAAAAVNPAFAETEFVTSNGQITTGMKDKPQYESQELRVNFEEEPLEALLNAQGLGNASQSVIDSGVGHTSVHSEENGLDRSSPTPGPSSDVVASGNTQLKQQALDVTPANGEVPVMTSSPRASRDSKPVENRIIITTGLEIQADERNSESKEVSDTNIEGTRTRGASFVLLDATGESETDDTVDDNVENVSKAKEESKDETNIGHKSEGSLITKATADSRDGLDDIMNTEPGTRSGDASIDGESAHDGDAIIEANDDTDIECTSF
ncbi:protocadherin Fat 4-like [Mercenaria mercenaria]|uniref:protocadherin Fat 4-like n=1 Tax=Mercenaria mercenaria TaxID=6596 RepID=UPI00234E4696|nr:protocadherin Fat 4-like [Mercenaria mercenaria]